MSSRRHERQTRGFFGEEGQERLAEAHVAIVGVGGLGSHVVQQLSFLGVGSLALIDSDVLEEHNLNRLIGAHATDLAAKPKKVEIAKRLANSIDPSIKVTLVPTDLRTHEAFVEIKKSSCVFGCVDNDAARLVLNELCCAYEIPYIDLATDIMQEGGLIYGGRVFVNSDHNGCLYCYGEVSPQKAGLELSAREVLEDRDDIYGVQLQDLAESGPSVVSINGVIASLGVTEFMVMSVGLREPTQFLQYYADRNQRIIATREEPLDSDCYYCKSVRGQRDKVNIGRYAITPSPHTLAGQAT